MADQSDVANVLVNLISDALYPNGATEPSLVDGVSGIIGIKVFQGWPTAANLNTDLPKGIVYVSVYPLLPERMTSAFSRDWRELSRESATITTTTLDNTLTIGGTIAPNQNIAVIVNGDDYIYSVLPTDTLDTIAQALSDQIGVSHANTVLGSTITINGVYRLLARVGTIGTSIRTLKRQAKTFQITVWASCHDRRDPVAAIVDPILSELIRIDLPDGTRGNVQYKGSAQDDASQMQGIYRRDMKYEVDFATTQTGKFPEITNAKTTSSIGLSMDEQTTPITLTNIGN